MPPCGTVLTEPQCGTGVQPPPATIREVPGAYSCRYLDRQDNTSFRTLILGFRSARYYIVRLTRQ